MSDWNENTAIREASGLYCQSLLSAILLPVREVARFNGYAVSTHGSLKRDIDLIAVPWTEQARPVPELVDAICGAVGGVLGNCLVLGEASEKPHGRIAYTLVHPGFAGEIDLSIISPHKTET